MQQRGFKIATKCGGGGGALQDTIIGSARGKLQMVKGTWVLAMEVATIANHLPWFHTLLVVLLLSRPRNWWDLYPNNLARVFVNSHLARL